MTGNELRSLRRGAGYKAKELARRLGYGAAQWSRFECGHHPIPPSVEYAARWICQALIKERADETQG